MARSQARDGLRGDRAGQMMILSAVILLLAFIALAGMVARVSQLAARTTAESDRVILSDVAPLADAIDESICRLKSSATTTLQATGTDWTSGATTITGVTGVSLASTHVGMFVVGNGLPSGTRILAVLSASSATISQATTAVGNNVPISLTPCLAQGTTSSFSLGPATTPRLQDAVDEMLAHLAALEAQHGFLVEWSFECRVAGDASTGRAVVSLTDGSVWLQFRSTVPFTLAACP